MNTKSKILILLDGNALVHRAYHGLPPLLTKSGESVNAVYGFALTLLSVIEKFHPEYIAASFDLPGKTFRHKKFAEYKGMRTKAPDDLYAQFPRVKEMVRAFNIPIYEVQGFEADDCVGTLARQATEADPNLEVIIVTGDSDAFQLINNRVKVFTMRKGIKDTVLYDESAVRARYGISPEQLKDYKGLRGDTSDNIPGVRGIGEKGATSLLQQYGSLEKVYDALNEIQGALKKKLEDGREKAFLSKELGTIDTHAPVTLDVTACVTHDMDRERLQQLFRELGFLSLLKRLPGGDDRLANDRQRGLDGKEKSKKNVRIKTLLVPKDIDAFIKECADYDFIAVALDMQDGGLFASTIASVIACPIIAENKKGASIVRMVLNKQTRESIKCFLGDASLRKVMHDAKTSLKLVHKEGMTLGGIAYDTMIMAYLLNAGGKTDMEYIALSELNEDIGKNDTLSNAEVLARIFLVLFAKMVAVASEQTSGATLETVLHTVEMPLIPVLVGMEERGVRLNGSVLRQLSQELTVTVTQLEQTIYGFAGREFNINSPKQLAVILFEDLHIPTKSVKKLKTGFSTASAELVKLRDEYAIVSAIEQYRELFKLKNTYLDVLPRLVDAQSRVHTSYHQALTATGRLSSSDPNLQNIPARNQWSERIRSAFEAEEGCVFVGADYSQIELRVAAHLSNDPIMIEAFHRQEDIHKTTAALIHQCKSNEVTDDMRRQAKVLNFGLMYGMGAFGLAQAAGISQEEASKFIKGYFEKFSGMAHYLEGMKAYAREHGFVETEIGRRRSIPEINSRNQQIAHGAERMAVNMPIQGLEADIVKMAMIATNKLIAERFSEKAWLLLQVHDELIFEVKEAFAEEFTQAVKQLMESVYPLKVPLIVEVFTGKNWGEI